MLEIDLDYSTDLKSMRPMAPAFLGIRALYSFRRKQALAACLQEAAREEPDCLVVLAVRSKDKVLIDLATAIMAAGTPLWAISTVLSLCLQMGYPKLGRVQR